MSNELSISVIMPAYNAAHYMEESLPPLIRMRDAGDIDEVIVVDDCSTQSTNIETAKRLGATVMQTAQNGGPGAARNYASTKAKGDIVWFVDADVIAHETGAKHILEAFQDESVVAVFGSYDDKPPANNFASQYKNLVHRYYHQRAKGDATTFWAGCGAIRRKDFLGVGGFDKTRYRKPAIEDIEIGYRLTDAGGRIKLVHDLLGTHLKNWSLVEVFRTDVFQRAIPWSRLMLESKRQDNDLNVSGGEKVRAVIGILWLVSLLALPGAFIHPFAAIGFAVMTPAMLWANWPLLGFFVKTKGLAFAAAALLYHQFYYLYSTVAYSYCVAENILLGMFERKTAQPSA